MAKAEAKKETAIPKDILKERMSISDWAEYMGSISVDNMPEKQLSMDIHSLVNLFKYASLNAEKGNLIDSYTYIRNNTQQSVLTNIKALKGEKRFNCPKMADALKEYGERSMEYNTYLEDRLKAISDFAKALDQLEDTPLKEELIEKIDNMLGTHEAIALFQDSLEDLRVKFEIEKFKYNQRKSNAPDALCDKLAEVTDLIASMAQGMGYVSGKSEVHQRQLEKLTGEYPEGIRALGEMAYKDMSEKLGDTLVRLNKAGIKGIDEDIFYAHFVFNHSLSKIAADLAKNRNWKRDRSTISRHIADIKLKLNRAKINSNMIAEIRANIKAN